MSARKAPRPVTRRDFVRSSAVLTTAALGGPFIALSSVFGRNAPSNRITLGIIGCGNQSRIDIPGLLKNDNCQIVAVCDVNRASYGYRDPDQFFGREPQREFVNRFYAEKTSRGSYKGCDIYTDFREILARSDVDAVAIITPDHWHAPMTVLAARAGKDIYCQKPLSLTVNDGRDMVEAVRRHRRVLQTGSQWRSNAMIRQACELVRNGRIGKLQRVETYVMPNNVTGPGPGWKEMPIPDGFDYDRWLGPAPKAPYHLDRCLYRFRFISDYSGGQTTNYGAHSIGVAHWAMGADRSGPVEVEDLGAEFPVKGSLFNTATKIAFGVRYADGTVLECRTNPVNNLVTFYGTKGWLRIGRRGLESEPATLKDSTIGPNELRLPVSADHYRNFLDCVKSRQDPVEPVEAGHRTASMCHLGNIAMTLHRKFKWDPVKEAVVDDAEVAKMLSRPMRAPWDYRSPGKA
jgi:predicted dehydrogenase